MYFIILLKSNSAYIHIWLCSYTNNPIYLMLRLKIIFFPFFKLARKLKIPEHWVNPIFYSLCNFLNRWELVLHQHMEAVEQLHWCAEYITQWKCCRKQNRLQSMFIDVCTCSKLDYIHLQCHTLQSPPKGLTCAP